MQKPLIFTFFFLKNIFDFFFLTKCNSLPCVHLKTIIFKQPNAYHNTCTLFEWQPFNFDIFVKFAGNSIWRFEILSKFGRSTFERKQNRGNHEL